MSWTMNLLEFETADQLLKFVQSDKFVDYVDRLKPFIMSIDVDDKDDGRVYGQLPQRESIWWGEDKLTLADWENTYSTPFTQPDKDPTDKQQQNLSLLKKIEEAINGQLNKE